MREHKCRNRLRETRVGVGRFRGPLPRRPGWRILGVLVCLLLLAGPSWALFGVSKRPQPGSEAPRFAAPLLRGGTFDLGTYLGKNPILLDFWSIYCVACLKEMPSLLDIYERYKDQGLVAVSVNLDSFGAKRVLRFVRGLKYEITFPIVIDKRREAGGRYGVSVLPTTVVIDREGKVLYYHVGYSPGDEKEIEAQVRKALGLAE